MINNHERRAPLSDQASCLYLATMVLDLDLFTQNSTRNMLWYYKNSR